MKPLCFAKLLGALTILSACASKEVKRTKFTDKAMRIMIDPASVDVQNYTSIQSALVQSNNWVVVDRARGLAAIKKEQEQLHRTSIDRFEDKEKFAHWGKLYGVGGVLVGHVQCRPDPGAWTLMNGSEICQEYLTLMDSNTGEVLTAVSHEEEVITGQSPNWDAAVEKLNAAYPKYFETLRESEKLARYKMESQEAAQRQREVKVQEELGN